MYLFTYCTLMKVLILETAMETEYVYMFKNTEEKLRGAQWVNENKDIGGMANISLKELIGVCTCTKTRTVYPVTLILNQVETDIKLNTIEEFAEQVFILNLEK